MLLKSRFVELFGDPVINTKGYPVKNLKDIAEYWNGLTYKPEDVSEKGTIVLRSSNIQNSKLDFDDTVRVSCSIAENKYVKNNDILMCSRNGSAHLVGKVALIRDIQEPMSFGAFMMIIRSKYYPYLMTFFQHHAFRQQISTAATTTINQITGKMLDNVRLPVPSEKEMSEFIKFTDQLDKLKVILNQIDEKIELLKKSRFIEMFSSYQEKNLSEVADITMGQSPSSNSYNKIGIGLPFYQGKTEFSDKYIEPPATWCSAPVRIAEKNDILMSVRAPVGDVNIATDKCCIGRGLASIRPLDGESIFLFYALKLKKNEIESKGNGSTFKAINKETVHSIKIPDVPQALKVKYSMFAEHIDKLKVAIHKEVELIG